jgi:hypothetical protein
LNADTFFSGREASCSGTGLPASLSCCGEPRSGLAAGAFFSALMVKENYDMLVSKSKHYKNVRNMVGKKSSERKGN